MGTHPIFESDFDCLTECFELVSIESSQPEAYQNPSDRYGTSPLPLRALQMNRMLFYVVLVEKFMGPSIMHFRICSRNLSKLKLTRTWRNGKNRNNFQFMKS